MSFRTLRIANWRQFSDIEIDFHRNLTIITGANGAGKSTILNILGQMIGAHKPYLAVPSKIGKNKTFSSSTFSIPSRILDWFRPRTDPNWSDIGEIYFNHRSSSVIRVPTQGQQSYSLHFEHQQPVKGFLMPSHRAVAQYRPIPNLDFGGKDPNSAFDQLISETYSNFQGNHTGYSLLYRIKELLANWANSGEGNSVIEPDFYQKNAYNGFIDVLHKILPEDLGFRGLKVVPPDIVVETDTGDFMIDALSGGLTAVIEMAALIYTRSLKDDVSDGRFVVTMDEPENHLHPAIQRTILSNLVHTFPDVQFIVATHSPFIVTSSKDSNVYALRYENVEIIDDIYGDRLTRPDHRRTRRVRCVSLTEGGRSGSPSEILRDVLGMSVTMPLWVEDQLENIVNKYRDRPFNEQTIRDLKNDINNAGLTNLFPEAMLHLGRTN